MKEIDYQTLMKWKKDEIPFTLIDVREPSEHMVKNIGGQLIPLSDIMVRYDELPKQGRIVVYCKRGIRSQIAIQKLARKGSDAEFYNLTGGILAIPQKEQ